MKAQAEELGAALDTTDLNSTVKDVVYRDFYGDDDDRLNTVLPKRVEKIELHFGDGTWGETEDDGLRSEHRRSYGSHVHDKWSGRQDLFYC